MLADIVKSQELFDDQQRNNKAEDNFYNQPKCSDHLDLARYFWNIC